MKDKHRDQVDSPDGSSRVEGRYHTTDEDLVLCLSDTPTLSMNETTGVFQTVPVRESAWYTAMFDVELSRVLDLTETKTLGRLGINPTDLVQPEPWGHRLTQEIARKARSMGFEAILAPTARPGLSGRNLVVFLEVVAATGGTVSRS